MEKQINIGDQNTRQIGQNPISQPTPIPEKPKLNYWVILTEVLLLLVVGFIGGYIFKSKSEKMLPSASQSTPSSYTLPTTNPTITEQPTQTNQQVINLKKLLNVATWKVVDYENISFKIPGDYRTEIWESKELHIYKSGYPVAISIIRVENFTGGSRRQWYLNKFKDILADYELSQIKFQEVKIGSVEALDVIFMGPANLGYTSPTLIANNSMIVEVEYTSNNRKTRDEVIDTIISTVRFKRQSGAF